MIKLDTSTFENRLKLARFAKGWNCKELALYTGISAAIISRYERGTSQPTAPVLAKLARALGVSTDYLILGVEVDKK
ncbi:helix-turn-helix domain-containing protein [Anaerovibrio lipolyticus]|uniref:helix-turn-helix domain-containing protein n=1 Tax=Anaerovibrio lipolyticus TaxID=82374 RepID=UPI00068B1171|nr:helix-turn-helix transcriptional regulator [Anaerovibrio lipolyticus]